MAFLSQGARKNCFLFFFFTVKSVTVTWKSKQAVDILGKGSLKMNTVTINQVLHKNSAVHRFAESS